MSQSAFDVFVAELTALVERDVRTKVTKGLPVNEVYSPDTEETVQYIVRVRMRHLAKDFYHWSQKGLYV